MLTGTANRVYLLRSLFAYLPQAQPTRGMANGFGTQR